jgi:STE24 endopeptidase
MLGVFVLAPEMLRRVLHTERLPDSPLRRRLESMCHDAKLGYRDILLWRTQGTMANAAVMGMVPRLRYVLLSDLLLESMTDEQIEAVFAHELGHVVHRHLLWFGLYAVMAMLFFAGPGDLAMNQVHTWYVAHFNAANWEDIEGIVAMALGFGAFMLAFGILSPRFERQADVYAARTMERVENQVEQNAVVPYRGQSYVGEAGAGLFASALQRVAVINHIPVSARNLSHGSIEARMRALYEMSADPTLTWRFDRSMRRVYASMLACLCGLVVWVCALSFAGGASANAGTAQGAVGVPVRAAR